MNSNVGMTMVKILVKPPPYMKVFTCNTWDSSGVNPESKARWIYTWTVKCITRKHQLGVVWLANCTTAGIQIIIVLLIFTVFPFLPNWNTSPSNFWQRISHTVGCIPANKPSIASWLLRALTVLFSCLECSVKKVLTVDLSARYRSH